MAEQVLEKLCPKHAEEVLRLYCGTCRELICLKCTVKGGGHQNHRYKDPNKAFEQSKKEVTTSLEPMKEHVRVMNRALEQLDKCCGEISDQRGTLKSRICGNFRHLRELLDTRETTLIGQLNQMTESKLRCLGAQREEIETNLAQYNTSLQFVEESLLAGNCDVLTMSTVRQIAKELTSQFLPGTLKPVTQADIEFLGSDNLASYQDYGQLLALGSPDPSKCRATGKGVKNAMVGETSMLCVKFEDSRCKEPIKMPESLEFNLVSEVTGARLKHWKTERRKQSHYDISYVPNIKGRHQLHIAVDGQQISGSPFSVVVKAPVEKLGTPIRIINIGRVTRPVAIAINQKRDVFIAGTGRCCLSVFNPSRGNLEVLSSSGSNHGECQNPQGLALDGEGNIFVADTSNHRIQKFPSNGQYFIAAVGTKGSGPLQFLNPTNIAFNASNKRWYVVDSGNNRVQILNSNLTFYESFGSRGGGNGQFSEPCGIACDSTGKVYVADSGNHRIQVFTAEGEFLRMFGRCGQGRGELNLPCFIAIGPDTVYISETGNQRVSVFTSEGHFMTSFGRKGERPGEFDIPCGLVLDDSGVLYVCDSENNRIQAF